jgi:hypothetical protein
MARSTTQASHLPRLLFFRWTRPGQPGFLLDQLAQQLACLRLFFEVELIDYDCSYDEVCDRFQPDLALFESGVYVGPRRVTHLDSHPHVPKLGFLNADAFDPVRAVCVSDMAEWGVEQFFTVSLSMAEYTPELGDRLFTWPNFVDPGIHKDHGLPKVVPITLTGSQARHYPWRNRVNRVLAQHYPVLSMPHFGWAESRDAQRMAVGSAYSRLIGAASMAPSCGSFTRDLVRKHLEIPAARTCLITERTKAVEAAGFVDMQNCVFADADDVLDKVDHLFRNPEELEAITEAGFTLVHERHTAAHRRQIRDWYDLFVATGSDVDVVQESPCGSLVRRASGHQGMGAAVVTSPARDRILIRDGWRSLARGRLETAARSFAAASNFQYMPESEVGKAWVQLLAGNAATADDTVRMLLDHNVRLYGPVDPDPVQWALHIRALLCRGALEEAREAARIHAHLRHPELERIRVVVASLAGEDVDLPAGAFRPSVSPLPSSDWSDWLDCLGQMLTKNRQTAYARSLVQKTPVDPTARAEAGRCLARGGRPGLPAGPAAPPRRRTFTARVSALASAPATRAREAARRWVTTEWIDHLSDVAEREELDVVLLAGASRWSLRQRSLRLAVSRSTTLPDVRCVDLGSPAAFDGVDGRTMVHLGGGEALPRGLGVAILAARVVVVENVMRPGASELLAELGDSGEFEVVGHSLLRGGYCILRHRLGSPGPPDPQVAVYDLGLTARLSPTPSNGGDIEEGGDDA